MTFFFICIIVLNKANILIAMIPELSDEFINKINDGKYWWTAGRNFPANTSLDILQELAGTIIDDQYYGAMNAVSYKKAANIPVEFDSRQNWKRCPSIKAIKNQGVCASCWAIASASAMTDRFCIHSHAKHQYNFSYADLHTCCISLGCRKGGYVSLAWQYWNLFGIVSGGDYESKEGCKPYQMPPCDYKKGCSSIKTNIPICIHKCLKTYHRSYKKDKRFAKRVYTVRGGQDHIKDEIYRKGPVTAVIVVYSDFLNYKKGVYNHVKGSVIGGHAVKIIGWGEESGHPYWLVANTWGSDWGDKGFFKIMRGNDHCRIESFVLAGQPSYDNHKMRTGLEFNLFDKFQVELQW